MTKTTNISAAGVNMERKEVEFDLNGLVPNNDLRLLGVRYPSDKVQHGYLGIYHNFFISRRLEPLNFVELGVYAGGSMMMWRDFFCAANILGVDIRFDSRMISFFENTRHKIHFLQCDSASPHLPPYVNNHFRLSGREGIDILIDDASHLQYDMMTSLANFYPSMNSGGIYVIEDMCSATDLEAGAKWWGSADESSDDDFKDNPGMDQTKDFDKQWLPNGKKDTYYCAETTMERFKNTGVFDSAFCTPEQNKYISENTDEVHFFKAGEGNLATCGSSVAVLIKK
jgi:hypothetical protein